jgi:hypothetical protein
MNIVEYRTVSAMSSKELDNAVNRQMKLGFQPYGAPYVAGSGSSQSLYQALVKLEGAGEQNQSNEPKKEEDLKAG